MKKTNNPQPKHTAISAEEPAAPEVQSGQSEGSNVLSIKGAGTRKSIFDVQRDSVTQAAADKIAVMGDARQKLAEASDLFRAGDTSGQQAVEVASEAAMILYQGRAKGVVSAEEVSATLGDIFGYKVKGKPQAGAPSITAGVPRDYSKDGVTASKTPFGQGEAIRKRIVRASQAHDYVNDGNGGKFFEGLPVDDVASIVASMEAGELGFWAAYESFASLKREHTSRTEPAFNPKHIAGLVEKLSEEGAADNFAHNPDLVVAYAALMDVLRIVGEAAAEEEAEAA